MIGIHTHLLPACDDGSTDFETSLRQLKLMAEAGVTDVVLTPHYLRNQYHNTRERILPVFHELANTIKEKAIPIILHLGAEVYIDQDVQNDIISDKLMINDTNYVLVETGMNDFPPHFLDALFQIVRNGFTPVLAHPERYSPIMENIKLAEDLLHRNVLMQINIGSLTGGYGRKAEKTAWKLLDKGYAHFLASDNHGKRDDYPYIKTLDSIRAKFDDYFVSLLTEIHPRKLLNNEKIEVFYMEKVEIELTPWERLKEFFFKRN
jgi:protein-tyrosine phosphatase